MKSDVATTYELRKAVQAIHTSGELSLVERKLTNILLLNAFDNLQSQRVHRIPVPALMVLVGWEDSGNQAALKEALNNIARTAITFDLLNKKSGQEWGVTTFLAAATIRSGICEYEYSKKLSDLLAAPEMYSVINLRIQSEMTSAYSLNLYENCHRFAGVSSTGSYPVEVWRKMLGATTAHYDDFRRLREKVLSKAIAEINDVTDIEITPHYTRQNRRVTEIAFEVRSKKQQSLFNPSAPGEEDAELTRTALYQLARRTGFAHGAALKFMQQDAERFEQACKVVETRIESGHVIVNPAGYARKLFLEGHLEDAQVLVDHRAVKRAEEEAAKKVSAERASKQTEADARADETRTFLKALAADAERVAQLAARYVTEFSPKGKFDAEKARFTPATVNMQFKAWLTEEYKASRLSA